MKKGPAGPSLGKALLAWRHRGAALATRDSVTRAVVDFSFVVLAALVFFAGFAFTALIAGSTVYAAFVFLIAVRLALFAGNASTLAATAGAMAVAANGDVPSPTCVTAPESRLFLSETPTEPRGKQS